VILVDQIAQYRTPFVVEDESSGQLVVLNNTSSWRESVRNCAIRYVLRDELVRLCAELAYSKGARNLECADLLHAPAEQFWIEWCSEPWRSALDRYDFPPVTQGGQWLGRRGALVRASSDGRRGLIRTFWSGRGESDVLASSLETYFDFDTSQGEQPQVPDDLKTEVRRVCDGDEQRDDVLIRCFRFRYEKSWADYYERAALTTQQKELVWRHALGTIAMDIPILLTFLLLLASRSGLPQEVQRHEQLNRARRRTGKHALLEHIEVQAPMLPEHQYGPSGEAPSCGRRGPRLHHVRGHLVRRGSQLFWRVPHLRGNARWGAVRSRSVVWTFDENPARLDAAHHAVELATMTAGQAILERATGERS